MSDGVPAPAIVTAGSVAGLSIPSENVALTGVLVLTLFAPFDGTVEEMVGFVESISKSAGVEEVAVLACESLSSARTRTRVESIAGTVHA